MLKDGIDNPQQSKYSSINHQFNQKTKHYENIRQ